ncbi:MAG: hypothetical protein EXR47_04055 [Dehalococcoidia bacterium]|nr:hypothetical protein [Dehalococcoidia bacterium]
MNAPQAFGGEYKGKIFVINQDGFIGLQAESPRQATELLNELMATAWLADIDVWSTREFELGPVEIDPEKQVIGSRSSSLVSLRLAPLFDLGRMNTNSTVETFMARLRRVSVERMRRVVSEAERLTMDARSKNQLLFLFEGRTYLASSEYRQSSAMAWLAIESWLDWAWDRLLTSKAIPASRHEFLSRMRLGSEQTEPVVSAG